MYKQIQQLKLRGYSRKRVSTELKLDRGTVRKYFDMSEDDFVQSRRSQRYRFKELDAYCDDILDIYQRNDNQRLNMAAVYDYLEEKYGNLKASEKSLRNYIGFLQNSGQLVFNSSTRISQKVPELPFGKQMQLDFGQYRCKKSGLKLYIFATVLSASRYRYIVLQDTPFSTKDIIYHLLDTFEFFGGIPKEIAIDQDRLMVVSENSGDILYTKDFKYFKEEMGFDMFVCRKADPQSKGKVENLIKYVKYNFFNTRDFSNLEDANESLLKWLHRRANGKITQATKRIPSQDFEIEREFLLPVRNSIFRKDFLAGREERIASDKSKVMVKSNTYQLPTKYKGQRVDIYVTELRLIVFDINTGAQIIDYALSPLTGKDIGNRELNRLKEIKLQELKSTVLELYCEVNGWQCYVKNNFKVFNRYVRDQTIECFKYFRDNKIDEKILERALAYCLENKTYSFSNLNDTYNSFCLEDSSENNIMCAGMEAGVSSKNIFQNSNQSIPKIQIQTRAIAEYKNITMAGSK